MVLLHTYVTSLILPMSPSLWVGDDSPSYVYNSFSSEDCTEIGCIVGDDSPSYEDNSFSGEGCTEIYVIDIDGSRYTYSEYPLDNYLCKGFKCPNGEVVVVNGGKEIILNISPERLANLNDDKIEELVHKYVNAERQKAGVQPLKWDKDLANIADHHSTDMAKNSFMGHSGSDGKGPTERAEKYGYPTERDLGGGYVITGIGENVAYTGTGYVVNDKTCKTEYIAPTEEAIVRALVKCCMDSEGHKRNIQDSAYVSAGIGIEFDGKHSFFATQDFF
ncbi:MAG: CAP domain-containing protein [Candidatus Aenigmatarchaeota archaeon]